MNLRSKLAFFIALNNYVEMIVNGVAPLSLPRAKAKPITKLTAFGGTEQRNLPDGYVQRQFIYMMDESYIDTGIVPDNAGKIEIDFQTTSVQTKNTVYLGTRSSTSTGAGISVAHSNIGDFVFDNFGTRFTPSIVFTNNTRYSYVFDNGTLSISSGGSVLYTIISPGIDTTTHSLYINALNNAGTVYGNYEGIYLYSFKVWNAQGVLVADYVPAIQKGTVPVVGFYDTVSGTFKTATAGTFAAGGEAVPTPDAPMDIVSNNGVLRVPSDIHNTATDTLNAYLDTNNAVVPSTSFCYTDYIPVIAGEQYYIGNRSTTDKYILAYDSSKNYIGYTNDPGSEFIYTVPSGISYIRCNYQSGYGSFQVKLNKPIYADGAVETINVHGKNLFGGVIEQGALNTSSGQPQDSTVRVRSANYTAVQPSTTYTLSATITNNIKMGRVFFYQSDGTFISKTNVWENLPVIFTTPSNAAKVLFVLSSSASGTTIVPSDAQNVQLEQGSTATTYEPYYDGGTATAEMLLKVGDYQDSQSIIDGVVTRKIGIKVLDGTEDGWNKTNNSFTNNTLFSDRLVKKDLLICSHFQYDDGTTSNIPNGCFGCANTTITVYFRYNNLSTAADWTQWLADQYAAGTPVIIVYPLATETTDTVTGQPMNTTAGDNILEITQASLDALELECRYFKGK